MSDGSWRVDPSGFNVIQQIDGGVATVALLQPHARIKDRAHLIAAAPALLVLVEDTRDCLTDFLREFDDEVIGDDGSVREILDNLLERATAEAKAAKGESP